jgi:hypothetical protein
MSEQQKPTAAPPQPNTVLSEPATVQACAQDYKAGSRTTSPKVTGSLNSIGK